MVSNGKPVQSQEKVKVAETNRYNLNLEIEL